MTGVQTCALPILITGGYRTNVIPSEGTATIDTRLAPDEDPAKFLELVKEVVNDPQVEVAYGARDTRPPTPTAKLDSDAFKALGPAIMPFLAGRPELIFVTPIGGKGA